MSFFNLTYVLLWIVVVFESLVLVLVLRELGVLYLGRREAFERDGPAVGTELPVLAASTQDGSPRTLTDLAGTYRAFLFGAPGCRLCAPVLDLFERWSSRVQGMSAVMLVERVDKDGPVPSQFDRPGVWWLERGEMFKAFGVRVSPYAVITDESGRVVAKGLVNRNADIKRLLREARDQGRPRRHVHRSVTPQPIEV